MKKSLLHFFMIAWAWPVCAQISITSSDMPLSGDTLRFSIASATSTSFSISDTGVSRVWDYSSLLPIGQGVDTFKSAAAVNITYALTISPSAFGYKVADSIPGLSTVIPVSIKNVYTFFSTKTSPSRYVAEGFAAIISGIPTPANYSDEDEWYFFPLNYLNTDSSTFLLNFSIPSLFSVKQAGYRKTRVDAWGTIKTPYFSSPVSCIRVRSEIIEVDSIDVLGVTLGLPRNTVEYKFLVKGVHYPALWVSTNKVGSTETVSSIRYYDSARSLSTSISNVALKYTQLEVYPNPVNDEWLKVVLPTGWQAVQISVLDMCSKKIMTVQNTDQINVSKLVAGSYFLYVQSGTQSGYASFLKL